MRSVRLARLKLKNSIKSFLIRDEETKLPVFDPCICARWID